MGAKKQKFGPFVLTKSSVEFGSLGSEGKPAFAVKKSLLCLSFLAALIALLAYSQFFGISIMEFDALSHILSHPKPTLAGVAGIFSQPHDLYLNTGFQYRPIQSLAWLAVFSLFGLNFGAQHMLNFFLHALNTFLVFFLTQKLLRDKKGLFSLFASLIFALHPVHINTVLFVSRLPELLAALFLMLSLFSFIAFLEKRKTRFFFLSLFLCFLGIFSKEAGSLIPLILLIYCLVFLKQKNISAHIKRCILLCLPFLTTIVLYFFALNISLWTKPRYIWSVSASHSQRAFTFARLLFYPLDVFNNGFFEGFYNFLNAQLANIFFIIYTAFLAILILHHSSKRRNKTPLFLFSWLFLSMLVLSAYNLLPSWYMYMPSIPFSILLAYFLMASAKNFSRQLKAKAGYLLIALLFIYFALLSPLFTFYPQPWQATEIMENVFPQTLALAQAIPKGSTIYLANYPQYLRVSDKGFSYQLLMFNDGSVQAFLDYMLPEKNFEAVSLTASNPNEASLSKNQFVFRKDANCSFTIQNTNSSKAWMLRPKHWKQSEKEADLARSFVRIREEWPRTQVAEASFPESLCRNSFLFFFDGKDVSRISLGS